jgi:hypothetical protein
MNYTDISMDYYENKFLNCQYEYVDKYINNDNKYYIRFIKYLEISKLIIKTEKLNTYELSILEIIQSKFNMLQNNILHFSKNIKINIEIFLLLGKYDFNNNNKFVCLNDIITKYAQNIHIDLIHLLKVQEQIVEINDAIINLDDYRYLLEYLLEILNLYL